MNATRIAIIGGGVSGLYAAFSLEQRGIKDYVIFEAREVLGGRIVSAPANSDVALDDPAHGMNRFDLGPTWYWPTLQPQLHSLIRDLGLQRFEQFEKGDLLIERTPGVAPTRMPGYVNSPASMRLSGGMAALTDALLSHIDPARVITGRAIRRLSIHGEQVELSCEDSSGEITAWSADHVLLAMPPRLVEHSILFAPVLPNSLALAWRNTPTWMASHAKYIAVYDSPFWRELGLSGAAHSSHGPLTEIHDASMLDGSAALFGFFGVPAPVRQGVSDAVLRSHCRAQFARLFGERAGSPKTEFIKDWAADPYTATARDMNSPAHHTAAPLAAVQSDPWRSRVTGVGSEWSPQFPGYVAGAIEAANLGVQRLLESL